MHSERNLPPGRRGSICRVAHPILPRRRRGGPDLNKSGCELMTFPEPDWQSDDGSVRLFAGDCLSGMLYLPDACVDSVVTDPPYGLGFMGKEWDALPPGVEVFAECLRVLKPGGHLLSFGGSRTYHRMACAVEDAGFEIRDQIMWVYGSGFPKSLDVSKSIDKAAGAEREVGQPGPYSSRRPREEVESVSTYQDGVGDYGSSLITAPATPEAAQWSGWGTALKPAHEPLVLARKPLTGTVAANVLEHGTGGINVDACRVNGTVNTNPSCRRTVGYGGGPGQEATGTPRTTEGRWPANLIHDGSDEVVGLFPVTSGGPKPERTAKRGGCGFGMFDDDKSSNATGTWPADTGGSAARFFYCAKASKSERTCNGKVENRHPTVKPLALMRYLVRLITPPGGIVLDPFTGSGTTGIAAVEEGFGFIGFEQDAENFQTAKQRVENVCSELDGLLFTPQLEAAS